MPLRIKTIYLPCSPLNKQTKWGPVGSIECRARCHEPASSLSTPFHAPLVSHKLNQTIRNSSNRSKETANDGDPRNSRSRTSSRTGSSVQRHLFKSERRESESRPVDISWSRGTHTLVWLGLETHTLRWGLRRRLD